MTIAIKHYDAKFKKELNPKVGLIALSTDQTIEGDFNGICKNLPLDIFKAHVPLPIFVILKTKLN